MILEWFDTREATKIAIELADQFAPQQAARATTNDGQSEPRKQGDELQIMLQRADREVTGLRLNFYKTAKLANSFKWRLLENGVERKVADEVTGILVAHISGIQADLAVDRNSDASTIDRPQASSSKELLAQGNKRMAQGAYAEAIEFYQDLVTLNPQHVVALNNLGAALCKLGRYGEAEHHFRRAIKFEPSFADPYGNLGNVLRATGRVAESEDWLRQALKLKPTLLDVRNNLGLTLASLGRLRDAKAHFNKVLKRAPRDSDALFGLGYAAGIEGRFDEAEGIFNRVLKISPRMPSAWASLAELRKMTPSDGHWLKGAEALAASGIAPLDEAAMRFAIGKYYDDVEDFKRAFRNYQRGNELLKTVAGAYDRAAHTHFVNDMTAVYSRETCARARSGASDSVQPIFIVGMPRSGTSLTEQIIASHPAARGAGELAYWTGVVNKHEMAIRSASLDESTGKKLAEDYLRVLREHSGNAPHIIDKAPVNCDYLGLIHSVFPKARIIYMRRDPIDSCLSCYFQKFIHLSFTLDLSDLAHYYREHQRLMAHWRSVLPADTLLDVPYEGLVAHQGEWTRKILDFVGLEWDQRCLDFHKTERAVLTSSYWQVRQTIYKKSVARWRNYASDIGPLRALENMQP